MDVLEAMRTRVSVPPRLVGEPGPDDAAVEAMLDLAIRAPDHGGVKPWRFVVMRGDDRVRLGEVFAEALAARDPEADAEALEKERARPLRAPVVVAVLARVDPDRGAKVPVVEQVVAAGAAASNLLLAAHANGWGAMLLTGVNAYDPHVRTFFGLEEHDAIVGFVYLGTVEGPVPAKPRPPVREFVEPFPGR